MTNLRLWGPVQYDWILFLDADIFLLKPLDGVFDNPGAQSPKTFPISDAIKFDEPSLLKNYLFASHPEVLHTKHTYPPADWPNVNAGFFLVSPSLEICNYLTYILNTFQHFDSTYMEQSLLNYTYRQYENMLWARLHHRLNINLPNMNDVREGVVSVHAKLWSPGNELQPNEIELRDRWERAGLEMENYYMVAGIGRNLSEDDMKKLPSWPWSKMSNT
jgi:alpha-N-acetylglucosamine transferase